MRVPLVASLVTVTVVGCLQIELRIQLHDDGAATITERVRFSERLLDLSEEGSELDLPSLLTREAVLERMKQMGKGISLVSHQVRTAEGGSRESVAVFAVPDLNEFRYVSPFLTYTDYPENHIVKCNFEPLYKSRPYGGIAGDMAISFRPLKSPRGESRPDRKQPQPKEVAPAELQRYREIRYIFQDMLEDFMLRLTFESYGPIRHTGFGFRGYKARVNYVDMINFTDQDLDRWGGKFLDNEEIMLELVRLRLGDRNIVDTVYECVNNPSVPVFHPWGSRFRRWIQSDEIYIRPSRKLFDKHFKGKMLNFHGWGGKDMRPAAFEEIGLTEETNEKPE